MKILFVTNYKQIAIASGGFINDFINDGVFHGLRELYGNDVVDSTKIVSLYTEFKNKIPRQNLWGASSPSFFKEGRGEVLASKIFNF